MELYASGFNAWNQLDFERSNPHDGHEPEDLRHFTHVLTGDTIERPRAWLSHTTVTVDGKTRTAGFRSKNHQDLQASDPLSYGTLAEASNETVVILSQSGEIQQHRSLTHLLGRHQQPRLFTRLPAFRQVVAYETGFAALTPDGDVYTWGDERYGACLGREVSEDAPADRPALVTALQDLPTGPVAKLAAGGYVLAALTTGDDLYLWGSGQGRRQPGMKAAAALAGVTDEPAPVDMDGRDIADVAVGDSHLIVLTTEGDVFVTGDNGNGQLGLADKYVESWARVELDLADDRRAIGVAAGPRNSFILVQKRET